MIEFLLLTLAFAGGTWLGGWGTIVVIAASWSLWRRGMPWVAGVAAGFSWIALLMLTTPWAPLGRLAPRLGGVVGLPGWAVLVLPALFALALGWSAARVVARPRGSRVKG